MTGKELVEGGEGTSANEDNVGRGWFSAVAMTVAGGVGWFVIVFYGMCHQK